MTGGRRIRLSDVATDAGVSNATASRANNQPGLLSPTTLARVRASAARLGYVPDGAGRALASGRSRTIGAIVPTLDSAIFARALQSMQVTMAQEGFLLLVASHEASPAAETQAVRALLERGVDGLMLVGAERAPETTAMLRASAIPVVLTWCGDGHFASVTIDNALAGRLAARHLIELGHRRIGIVTGCLQFNDRQRARLEGARAAMRDAGVALPRPSRDGAGPHARGRTAGLRKPAGAQGQPHRPDRGHRPHRDRMCGGGPCARPRHSGPALGRGNRRPRDVGPSQPVPHHRACAHGRGSVEPPR